MVLNLSQCIFLGIRERLARRIITTFDQEFKEKSKAKQLMHKIQLSNSRQIATANQQQQFITQAFYARQQQQTFKRGRNNFVRHLRRSLDIHVQSYLFMFKGCECQIKKRSQGCQVLENLTCEISLLERYSWDRGKLFKFSTYLIA